MKLPWQKSEDSGDSSPHEQSPAHEAASPETQGNAQGRVLPKGYTPPKGRPTPRRMEQEIKRGVRRDPDALSPAQQREREKELKKSMTKEEWKEHKRKRREEARRSNKEIQARIDAGDDRFLMERDRGEVRRFVRDWVDSRRFLNNYIMPATLVMLVVLFIGTFSPRLSSVLSIFTLIYILVILGEGIFIGKRANNAVAERFPKATDRGFGLGMYAYSRATQPRGWRTPKPRVGLGATV